MEWPVQDLTEKYVKEKLKLGISTILGSKDWKLLVEEKDYGKYLDNAFGKLPIGRYKIMLGKEEVASWKLCQQVGCCGVCVSTEAEVSKKWQGKGLGKLLNSLRIDIARINGFSLLLCTDVLSNTYQRKILAWNGWRDVCTFLNRRTGNTVAISVVNLPD